MVGEEGDVWLWSIGAPHLKDTFNDSYSYVEKIQEDIEKDSHQTSLFSQGYPLFLHSHFLQSSCIGREVSIRPANRYG